MNAATTYLELLHGVIDEQMLPQRQVVRCAHLEQAGIEQLSTLLALNLALGRRPRRRTEQYRTIQYPQKKHQRSNTAAGD